MKTHHPILIVSALLLSTWGAQAQTVCFGVQCETDDISVQVQQMMSLALSMTDDPRENQECFDQCAAQFLADHTACARAFGQGIDPDCYINEDGQNLVENCQSIMWGQLNECINPFNTSNCTRDDP